jgi:hypothetical protein
MKPSLLILTLGLLTTAPALLHAQGSLTPPPGPPGPVMKTLDQVQPHPPLPHRNLGGPRGGRSLGHVTVRSATFTAAAAPTTTRNTRNPAADQRFYRISPVIPLQP